MTTVTRPALLSSVAYIMQAAGIAVVALPSSSPAHAALPLAAKRARWLQLAAWL